MPISHATAASVAAAYTAAWNSADPQKVASFYAKDGQVIINGGTPYLTRSGVAEMAAGFYADVPDLNLVCDLMRCAGDHAAYLWTFTGHHAETKNPLKISGWEEWDFDEGGKVKASRGWFDAADYAAQVAGD